MTRTTAISVRLPDELLARLREARETTGESQTAILCTALRAYLDGLSPAEAAAERERLRIVGQLSDALERERLRIIGQLSDALERCRRG